MKNKKIFLGAIALFSMFTLSLTSCSNDDDSDVANVKFSNVEIGHDNSKKGIAGKGFHIECGIVSTTKIKSIEVAIKQKGGAASVHQMWTDAKYTNVLETLFHEHVHLTDNLPSGTYHFSLIVTDMNNAKKSMETDITIDGVNSEAPVIKLETPNDKAKTGAAGSKLSIKAQITVKNPVKEIELEFHGADEYPIEIEGYEGKTGTFELVKDITIPAKCPAGEYHLHFTVTDSKGISNMEEVEGFIITK
ncbi:hypothetical protein HMPREF1870_02481 [Bacteroidales bacterium KA00344]|nr:hypothetical protein HMPREF1870_02481 [Bacteroidales bacterium KA00344]